MKLPNSNLAIVSEQKLTLYLLNSAHPAGGSKAAFFLRFGFSLWPTIPGHASVLSDERKSGMMTFLH
jgi:hypothetical protein